MPYYIFVFVLAKSFFKFLDFYYFYVWTAILNSCFDVFLTINLLRQFLYD